MKMRLLIFSSRFPEIYGGSKPKEYRKMAQSLRKAGIEPIHRFVTTSERLVRDIKEYKPDLVFAAVDHTTEEDGRKRISPILEELGVPYVGSDPEGLDVALNKVKSKRIWAEAGIRSPQSFKIEVRSDIKRIPLESYPLILKPVLGGGSRGITDENVVFTRDQLRKKFRAGLLVERYISGREFTVSIMGNGEGKIAAPSELVPQGEVKPIVITHQIKDGVPGTRLVEPQPLTSGELREKLAEFAGRMFESCGLRDYGRADIIMDDEGELYAIEINAQPVFESYYLTGFKGVGLDYDAVVAGVILASIIRWRREGREVTMPPLVDRVLPEEVLRRLERE